MNLPRVRFTIRGMMLSVLAVGLGLGAAVAVGSHRPGLTPRDQFLRTAIIAPVVAVSPLVALIASSIWVGRRPGRPRTPGSDGNA